MKTYLLDTFNKYKRYSDKLDAKTILCNRCWWVFNNSGEKESYIFREDGSIIISLSGAVTYGKWEYIAANQSVIISGNKQSYMVHPTFVDGVILALQVDGTETYAFLIDEQNKAKFQPTTYKEVIGYFEEKERKALVASVEDKKIYISTAKERKEEQTISKEEMAKIASVADSIRYKSKWDKESMGIVVASITFVPTMIVVFSILSAQLDLDIAMLLFFLCAFIHMFLVSNIHKSYKRALGKRRIRKYIKEHPFDPMNPYLKEYL